MKYKKNDQVIYRGKVCTVFSVESNGLTLDTGLAPVLYEHANFNEVKMHKEYVVPITIDRELWAKQQSEADVNTAKPIDELKIGDLIWAYMFGSKNCGNCIDTMANDTPYRRLGRIEKIVDNLTIEDVDSESFGQGKGGSASDCIIGEVKEYQWTEEQKNTFYSMVTLIKLKDGRHMFCDAQGYDYPRYILVSKDYETMFAPELAKRRNEIAEYERQREEEFKADRARQKAEAESYVATVLKDFKPAKKPKTNVKRLLHILVPDANFTVSQHTYWRTEVSVKSNADDVMRLKSAWADMESKIWYQTGEFYTDWSDQLGSYEYESSACALNADLGGYVYFGAD